jgi:hypothetical protein
VAQSVIRFGVANRTRTLRAATWRCWTNGGDDKSVYLTCRELGQVFHTSLHANGHWHTGFLKEKFDSMFEPAAQPSNRITGDWPRPQQFAPGWTIATFIYTPWHAVASTVGRSAEKISWAPAPGPGESCEFCILLGDAKSDRIEWPGQISMNTALMGRFEIGDGGQVVIVSRHVPVQEPSLPKRIKPRLFKGVSDADLISGNLNAIMWGRGPRGTVVFYDAIVQLGRD